MREGITNRTEGQYEFQGHTDTPNRICKSHKTCESDQYQSVPGSETHDRECEELDECGQGWFETEAPA